MDVRRRQREDPEKEIARGPWVGGRERTLGTRLTRKVEHL